MTAREQYDSAYELIRLQERLIDDFAPDGEWSSWSAEMAHARLTIALMTVPDNIRRAARRSRYTYKSMSKWARG